MAVHIRLSRVGAKKAPQYRVVVADQRSPREGRFIEKIGTYDPSSDPGTLNIDRQRLDYWCGCGAKPSHTLERLLKRQPRTVPRADGRRKGFLGVLPGLTAFAGACPGNGRFPEEAEAEQWR